MSKVGPVHVVPSGAVNVKHIIMKFEARDAPHVATPKKIGSDLKEISPTTGSFPRT